MISILSSISSFVSSFSKWDAAELVGVTFVLVGVVLGGWNELREFKPPNDPTKPKDFGGIQWAKGRKHFWWISEAILVIGLAIELSAVPHHLVETSNLNKRIEELRKENIALDKRVGTRTERLLKSGLANVLKTKPAGNVKIVVGDDIEALSFATMLYFEMGKGGWQQGGIFKLDNRALQEFTGGRTADELENLFSGSKLHDGVFAIVHGFENELVPKQCLDSFGKCGFWMPSTNNGKLPTNEIIVVVSQKP